MKKRAMARIAAYAATVLAATALAGVTSPLQASDPVSVESIVDALKKRKTRSVGVPESPAKAVEIEDLKRIRKTRGWNLHDRARLAKATQDLAQIDLVVYFAFNSSEIQKSQSQCWTCSGRHSQTTSTRVDHSFWPGIRTPRGWLTTISVYPSGGQRRSSDTSSAGSSWCRTIFSPLAMASSS